MDKNFAANRRIYIADPEQYRENFLESQQARVQGGYYGCWWNFFYRDSGSDGGAAFWQFSSSGYFSFTSKVSVNGWLGAAFWSTSQLHGCSRVNRPQKRSLSGKLVYGFAS